ncbi:P1 family peptidase [Phenylobacterium sp.]|uniref:P1 family peptidase n=1 Tax=Phenylobacterium sp. TaxID=1871053 RepID=UPI0035AEE396
MSRPKRTLGALAAAALTAGAGTGDAVAQPARARELGITPGVLSPGPLNAITDVSGVRVGHLTRHEEPDIHTGVTVVLPHEGNLFQDKVPAGLAVANGFGKLMGATQIAELGEIETPIALTNTLAVPRAADALIGWTLAQPGNEQVRSVNAVVGETNDGYLNNIRKRVIGPDDVLKALADAKPGPVAEGAVGAGSGTMAFGWKGGIGTSSRRLPSALGGYTVGVLVQSNYGGTLTMAGDPVGLRLRRHYLQEHAPAPREPSTADGSIMIVVATDAPLGDRNLRRLAERSFAGLARTGSAFTNGSGDYAIAFSTAPSVRRTPARRAAVAQVEELPNDAVSPLFVAVADATEEAIYNSLLMARTIESRDLDGKPVRGEALDRRALRPRS